MATDLASCIPRASAAPVRPAGGDEGKGCAAPSLPGLVSLATFRTRQPPSKRRRDSMDTRRYFHVCMYQKEIYFCHFLAQKYPPNPPHRARCFQVSNSYPFDFLPGQPGQPGQMTYCLYYSMAYHAPPTGTKAVCCRDTPGQMPLFCAIRAVFPAIRVPLACRARGNLQAFRGLFLPCPGVPRFQNCVESKRG